MQPYIITDTKTGEKVEVIAPNRDAALKAHVARRLTVERAPKVKPPIKVDDADTSPMEANPIRR